MAKVRRKVEIVEEEEKTLGGLPCKIEWPRRLDNSALYNANDRICGDSGKWQDAYKKFASGLHPVKHKGSMYQMSDWANPIGYINSPGREFSLSDIFYHFDEKVSDMISVKIGKIFLTTEKTFLAAIDAREITDETKKSLKKLDWRLSLMYDNKENRWLAYYWKTLTIYDFDTHHGYGWAQWNWDYDGAFSRHKCVAEYRGDFYETAKGEWSRLILVEDNSIRLDRLSEQEKSDAHYGWVRWCLHDAKIVN